MFGQVMTLKRHLNQIPEMMKSLEQLRFSIGVQQASAIKSGGNREFRVFSQAGEDGIIQWLIQNIDIRNVSLNSGHQIILNRTQGSYSCMMIGLGSLWMAVRII